jgi:OmpA-OmpF porin, OOP family
MTSKRFTTATTSLCVFSHKSIKNPWSFEMKLQAIASICACLMFTPVANAGDTQIYIGVDGGLSKFGDAVFDIGALTSAQNLTFSEGMDFGAVAGVDFGYFRIEGEYARRNSRPSGLDSATTTAASFGGPFVGKPAGHYAIDGRDSISSIMLNGIVDIPLFENVEGFVGGGIGLANSIEIRESLQGSTIPFLDDHTKSGVMGYQFLAGIRAPLTDNIDLSLKYRYFKTGRFDDLVDANGRAVSGELSSQSIMAGITFNFSPGF